MEEKKDKKAETNGKNLEGRIPQTKSETQKEDKKNSAERVSLKQEAYSKTEQWLSQIGSHHKGVRINRSDLVNFVLLQHAAELSEEELSSIGKTHFDEIRFYAWAIKAVREGRARGEDLTVSALERQYKIPK